MTPDEILKCATLCVDSYDDTPRAGWWNVGDLRFGFNGSELVFRGTANVPNALRDVFCAPERTPGGALAHCGFLEAYRDLFPYVAAKVPVSLRQSITVTGHSLGGAIALLFAESFGCRAVTFGCPRVYFRFGERPAPVDHLRFYCDDDPVPMMPYVLYRHFCRGEVLRDHDGGIDPQDHHMAVYLDRLQKREVSLCVV